MNLEEYNSFVQSFIDPAEYPLKENSLYFIASIGIEENEISDNKHLLLSFPEFLEAMCRAIDKASPYPPDEDPEDWPMSRREKQSLAQKLDNIIGQLIKTITNSDFKLMVEKFPYPIKDPTINLYIVDYANNGYYTKFPFVRLLKKKGISGNGTIYSKGNKK